MGRLEHSAKNLIAGTANKLTSMLLGFIIRTVIIKTLGADYLGLNSLFTSILSMLSISELGFGSAMVFSMYEPIAKKDTEKVNALLSLYRTIYRCVGTFILVVGLILLPFLDYLVEGGCPPDINLRVLYLLFLLNTVLSYFLYSYKSALFTASQREDVNSNISSITNITMYVLQIVVLFISRKYMPYIILMPIATIACNVIRAVLSVKYYPEYKCEGKVSKEEFKKIGKNVGALVGHKLSGTIILSSDNIVISAILGLTAVACYNNYYYIISSLNGFFMIFFNSLRASVGNSIIKESVEKNYRDFKKITTIVAWMAGWCAICLLCLFQPFITLWVGEEYLLPMGTVILLSVYFYEWKLLDTMVMYRDAAGMWWSDRFRPYIVSALNLIGNIALVYVWGLNGVIFATLFTSAVISHPWVMIVLFKEYFKNGILDYLKSNLIITCVLAVSAALTYAIVSLISGTGFIAFGLKAIVCCIVPNVIMLAIYGRKLEILKMIRKLLKRERLQE